MKHAPRGRPPSSIRPRVEHLPYLSLDWLRRVRGGRITWGRRQVIALRFQIEEDGVRFWFGSGPSALIATSRSELPGGGWCPYFVCPGCYRRRRKLLMVGARRLICRGCVCAVYNSQYEGALIAISQMRWRLRARLHHRDGIARPEIDDLGPRPRHMKRKIWATIEARDAELADRWNNGVRKRFGRVF